MSDLSGYTFTVFTIPNILISASLLILGFSVLVRERISPVSVAFFIMTFVISEWLFAFAWMYAAPDGKTALTWAKIAYLGVPCIPVTIFHFTTVVLRLEKECRPLIRMSWILGGLFVLLGWFTDAMIARIAHYWWGYYPIYGWLGSLFFLFFLVLMATSLHLYWRQYRHTKPGIARQRLLCFATAVAIGAVASVDFLAKYEIAVYPFGYLGVFGFLGVVAYAVWRYRLVDLTAAFAADQILETMQGAVLVVDETGIIRVTNRTTSDMLEYPQQDLVGMPLKAIFEAPRSSLALDRLFEVQEAQAQEMQWRTRAGTRVDVSVSASVLRNEENLPAGVVYVAMDITERKRIEEANVQLAAIVESSDDTIVSFSPNEVIQFWNQAAERMFQYTVDEAVGRSFSDLGVFANEMDGQKIMTGVLEASNIRQFETVCRRKDGASFPVSATCFPVKGPQGRIFGGSLILRDMTEWKHAQRQLRQAEKLAAIGTILGGVAHELKNPLFILSGNVQLAKDVLRDGKYEELTEHLEAIEESERRALRVIEGFLRAIRSSRGDVELCRVEELVQRTLLLMANDFALNRIHVNQHVQPDLPMVLADPDELIQVFLNLLANARQAIVAHKGGGCLSIGVRFEAGSEFIVVEVQDDGVGISPEHCPKIFDPFYTTKPADQGTGLGLSICHRIITGLGGTISCHSQGIGTGATFYVRLPTQRRFHGEGTGCRT